MGRPRKTNTTINGKDYYRIRRTIDGVQKSFYGTSKGDAEQKYRDYIEQKDSRTRLSQAHTKTFGALARDYVTDVLKPSNKYAKGTIERYESSYRNYIKDSPISPMKIIDVSSMDIQRFYNDLDVSSQAIQSINKFMKGFCKWCVLMGYCSDFMAAVSIPKKPENKRHESIVIWSDEEVHAILDAMNAPTRLPERHRMVFFVHTLLYTGARISEAISLRYSDFRDDGVHIDRQFYRGEMKPPKYNSSRIIPMHKDLADAFEEHKRWHKWDMSAHKYDADGYVFTTSSGKLYDPVNVRRALKRFYNRIGVEPKNVHVYRSTFCTQLCRCGVPLEVASSLMGHKSMEVTGKFYAFIHQETKEDAINKLHY